MAKRANPFVEDFIPQSKIHVGLKQFNNNGDRLQKVYEKTLELLFKGAKKTLENGNQIIYEGCSTKKDKMKQLFIRKDGTLSHSGIVVTNKLDKKLCKCGSEVEFQCGYCESVLCASCQHNCSKCDTSHCSRCILIGSEALEVCVSCYC